MEFIKIITKILFNQKLTSNYDNIENNGNFCFKYVKKLYPFIKPHIKHL